MKVLFSLSLASHPLKQKFMFDWLFYCSSLTSSFLFSFCILLITSSQQFKFRNWKIFFFLLKPKSLCLKESTCIIFASENAPRLLEKIQKLHTQILLHWSFMKCFSLLPSTKKKKKKLILIHSTWSDVSVSS